MVLRIYETNQHAVLDPQTPNGVDKQRGSARASSFVRQLFMIQEMVLPHLVPLGKIRV